MELIHQPISGHVGERVISFLNSQRFDRAKFVVAFAREAGIKRLAPYLDSFRARGGQVEVTCGIDLDGTSYEGLKELYRQCDSLSVFHAEGNQTFHPKMYCFLGQRDTSLIVGSSNLTAGGLWTNIESSLIVTHSSEEPAPISLDIDSYVASLRSADDSYRALESEEDIQELLVAGYIKSETALREEQKSHHRGSGARKRGAPLFGKGIPTLASPYEKPLKIQKESGDQCVDVRTEEDVEAGVPIGSVFWIYLRSITSGSGNQVDLSMKCRLENNMDASGTPFEGTSKGYMIGFVEYFGVDPSARSLVRHPILNYEGVDYYGSNIVFPDATNKGKRPNGSWRLQLNGKDETGSKLTEAIKNNGGLKEKIMAFTKLDSHYYQIDVYPAHELLNIQHRSHLLGWNGKNADTGQLRPPKPVGVIWTPESRAAGGENSREII
ncbi:MULTISPECIES: phospholipase D family protein [Kocuria]|nr:MULTISPECIES: phospholipase D family protein [Kocuria]RUQ10648.1 hypothetical protein D8M38_04160 [Kocuria sp. HSID17582]